MKENLDINEVHSLFLDMMKSIHSICVENGIVYYLAYGTLLGAVRHKGFIPWDDDMDIWVPMDQYHLFVETMKKELPSKYKCCTYDSEKAAIQPYAKISDLTTVIDDKCVAGLSEKEKIGINIDIFPLVSCKKNDKCLGKIANKRKIYQYIFTESTTGSPMKHIIKKFLRMIFPLSREKFLDSMWYDAENIQSGDYFNTLFIIIYGLQYFPKALFGAPIMIKFEDTEFYAPSQYKELLSLIYGDYMKLPPLDKRKTHLSNVYKRNV